MEPLLVLSAELLPDLELREDLFDDFGLTALRPAELKRRL